MKKLVLTIMIISTICKVNAQTKENIKYTALNILTQSITTGIGSVINHKKNESIIHAFGNGFWKGCVGSSINILSYKAIEVSAINNNLNYAFAGKILNSIGSSITYNAMSNDDLTKQISINLFNFNIKYENHKFNLRLDPLTSYFTMQCFLDKNKKIDLKNSFKTGNVIFSSNNNDGTIDIETTKYTFASNYGNLLYYKTNEIVKNGDVKNYRNKLILHELFHSMQYHNNYKFNAISLDILSKKINCNLNKYLYINFNFELLYSFQNMKNGYDNNSYEKEAIFFTKSNYN